MAKAKSHEKGGPGPIASDDHIGRMGVMYVRSLLAQAALGNAETSPGEDYLGTDLTVDFPVASIRVQVKTGHKRQNKDGSFSVSTTKKWRTDWATAQIPVYLVYVHLEKPTPAEWLEHPTAATTVHAHAHWVRVNGVSAATVRVPGANRLTVGTFQDWQKHIAECFGMAVTA